MNEKIFYKIFTLFLLLKLIFFQMFIIIYKKIDY